MFAWSLCSSGDTVFPQRSFTVTNDCKPLYRWWLRTCAQKKSKTTCTVVFRDERKAKAAQQNALSVIFIIVM